MPRGYSIFLDGIRLLAALTVLVGHVTQLSGGMLPRIAIEHDGVVIFFLLSGYVIGFCAHERETNLSKFLIARVARVFSVAIPALLLTMILDRVGIGFNPAAYPYAYEFRKWYLYLPLFWGFLSEIWLWKVSAFSDTPYWSLVYEVWYYLLFASFFFFRGISRAVFGTAILLVMGPKILLLAPLWLAGYALYRIHQNLVLTRGNAALLAVAAFLGYLTIKALNADHALDAWSDNLAGGWISQRLSASQFFLGDYLKGTAIFVFFLAMRYCMPPQIEAGPVAAPIRGLSQYTFSLYLFHFPILVFLAALFPHAGAMEQLLRVMAVFLVVFTLGGWCERQKGHLRRAIAESWRRYRPAMVQSPS